MSSREALALWIIMMLVVTINFFFVQWKLDTILKLVAR